MLKQMKGFDTVSHIDKKKTQKEEECLNAAIALAKKKNSKTKKLLSMLDCESVHREKNDSPDIIRKCKMGNRTIFVGIEHFLIDQASKFKRGKPVSIASQQRNEIAKKINQYQKNNFDNENEANTSEFVKKITKDSFLFAEACCTTGYNNILEGLKYSIDNHLTRIDTYKNSLKSIAKGEQTKLAFLIEIHCYFKNVFLNKNNCVKENTSGLIPIFYSMINELEKINNSAMDYIILYITDELNIQFSDVIVIPTGKTSNIANELLKQKIDIYEFCSDEIEMKYRLEDIFVDGFAYSTGIVEDSNYMQRIISVLEKAYHYKKNNQPFVATRVIQSLLYSYGENVTFVHKQSGEIGIIIPDSQEEVQKRFDEFTSRYSKEWNKANHYLI